MKKILLMCAVAIGLSAGSAQAALITADKIDQSGTITFDGNVKETEVAGLSAAIKFTLTKYDVNTNQLVFDVWVYNTSSAPITNSRISGFGFDTTPEVTAGSSTSEIFANVLTTEKFPNQFGKIDVCVSAGKCEGGKGLGVFPNAPHNFELTLTFGALTNAGVDFTNFGVRYQSLEGTLGESGTGKGTPTSGTLFDVPPPPVPEPTSLALLGLGLLGAGIARRRK